MSRHSQTAMKNKLYLYLLASVFLVSCATNKLLYKPYQLSLPKGFQKLSKVESDAYAKKLSKFKSVIFLEFYLKDSIAIGLYENKMKNPEFDVIKQTKNYHGAMVREAEILANNAEKYDGYQIVKKGNLDIAFINSHSLLNNNTIYYKVFLTQHGDEALKGLMVYSQADSVASNVILNRVIESIKIIP